jgi:hypothetical protein
MKAAAGSQSKVPAPAKAGVGHFQWLRSSRKILLPLLFLATGVSLAYAREDGLHVGVAQAREAWADVAQTDGAERRPPLAHISTARPAYRDGPPPGFSGGFGEDHCQACHFGDKVNDSPGRLTIGAPAHYSAGETYAITITLSRPGMAAGGFQLAVRFEDDSTQAGTLALPDAQAGRMKISEDRGVQYAYHLRPGTELTSAGVVRWTLRWTAPPGKRTVRFHVAANAANADDSQFGDFVYTSHVRSRSR